MINVSDERASSQSSCLGQGELQRLLVGDLSDIEEITCIGHLDSCHLCRDRLQGAAGDRETWVAVTRNLKEGGTVREPELECLMANVLGHRRLSRPTGFGPDEDLLFQVLEPCEKPGRIGCLDRYEVIETIGCGGMGIVLKGFDPSLERPVAIKVLASPSACSRKARERFRREARAAAAVRSEYVITIHAVEEQAPLPYLVMEYVEGTSLQGMLDLGAPMELEKILQIGAQAAVGLAAAHEQGLVHRDVKPANILLEEKTGAVKLTDFGLACAVDDREYASKGMLAGTPEYMAPEQAAAGRVDHRADLYSLGSVLYAMCTGGPPFHTDSAQAVLHRIRHDTPPRVDQARADLPEWLVDVIEKLHRMEPARRYSSAAEVADLFDGHSGHQSSANNQRGSSTGRRLGLAMASILFFGGVLGLGALIATQFEADGQEESTNVVASERETPVADVPYLVRRFKGHTGPASKLAFSPDGKLAVSGSGWPEGDRTMRLWNVETGQEIRQFRTSYLPGAVHSVAVAPDGRHVLSGSVGGFVLLWDIQTGKLVRDFVGHTETVFGVTFSPDGRLAMSCSRDKTARLWDIESGKELQRFEGHSDWVRCVALCPNGQRALTGGRDKTMRLWEVKMGKQLREFGGHDATVEDVAFATDGRHVLSSGGNAIRLWDIENGQEVRRFEGHSSPVTTAALSPDGRHVLSGSYDRTVRLWEVETGLELSRFADHRNWVLSVAISTDGRHVLSGGGGAVPQRKGSDFAIRLWDVGQAIAKAESDLRFQEMRKFQGTWKVISYELDGKPLEASTAQFVFRAAKVIVNDGDKRLEVHYGLSPTEEPKQITLSSFPGAAKGSVSGTYSWEEDKLIIRLALRADGLKKVEPGEQETIPQLRASLRRE